jgi:porphobilinogen synthase
VREALDAAGFIDTAILAYAAKYATALYGPVPGGRELVARR